MKKIMILSVLFALYANSLVAAPCIEFWFMSSSGVQYIDYDMIDHRVSGITYEYCVLDVPAEIVNTTYWVFSGGTWNISSAIGWENQFGVSYLWEKSNNFNNACWVLAYDSYTNLGYKMCCQVVIDTAMISSILDEYGVTSIHDTIYTQVFDTTYIQVFDTIYTQVYDTLWTSVFDTTYTVDTIYTQVFDTLHVVDTLWTSVFDTTYTVDTLWFYETTVDTVIIERSVSTTDTLIINLDEQITSATGVVIDDVVKVYPNPATVELHVECNANSRVSAIEIHDAHGVPVMEIKVYSGLGYTNISNLNKGLYIMVILDESAIPMLTKKLLIQ